MTARRTVVGLCMLCALAFSALAAQSASAVTKGTTAFTCSNTGTGFSDAHCKTPSGTGAFSHVATPENTLTATTGSNETTGGAKESSILKATIAGFPTEIESSTLTATATTQNKKATPGEHYWHFLGTITYTGLKLLKPEPASGCKLKQTEIKTNELTATTEGQGDALKVQPAAGTTFAAFTIEGCTGAFAELNKEYKAEGSATGTPEGATIKSTHATVTAAKTLKLNGTFLAGISGTLTFKGANGNPISFTTVETP